MRSASKTSSTFWYFAESPALSDFAKFSKAVSTIFIKSLLLPPFLFNLLILASVSALAAPPGRKMVFGDASAALLTDRVIPGPTSLKSAPTVTLL
ncbi:MAG: hypothetical protein EBY22_16450 [Gammaproteobacteria bacterium]|nr:hypothetical protein [Gammaproteobacteria bacterium]